MISAPSLRLPLNGSNILLVMASVILLVLSACSTPKKTIKSKPGTRTPVEQDDLITVYDPATGTYKRVPREQLGKEDTAVIVVKDTAVARQVEKEPILPKETKDTYTVVLLMPFQASNADFGSDRKDGRLNRFVQYYAGALMALEPLGQFSGNRKINIQVFDADATSVSLNTTLQRLKELHPDVIVGPYDREAVQQVADFGLANEVMVISPWQPAFTVPENNPFFIQLTPGLQAHAQAIGAFIGEKMPANKVYVVGRSKQPAEVSRAQLFINALPTNVEAETLYITDDTPELRNTNIVSLLSSTKPTVLILPYFSKSDEAFVYSVLRKFHAEKETKEVIIFGLPQWQGFTSLNSSLLEGMSVHLSTSSFIDITHPQYSRFRENFFNRFHTLPDQNAFTGYDLITWLSETLRMQDVEALIQNKDKSYRMATGFDIRPVYRTDASTRSEMSTPLYYENQDIRIIRYQGQEFSIVW